jgi:Flp pilus assembly protein TadD
VLTEAGRLDDAWRALQETVRAVPSTLLGRWWLAWEYERLQLLTEARNELALVADEAVLRGRGQVYAFIGRLSRRQGDFAGAVEALAERARLNPHDPDAHLELAYAHLEMDRFDNAFAELIAVLLLRPNDAQAHAAVGRIHLGEGNPDEAVIALRRALELKPDDFETRYPLASALLQLGRGDDARRELEAYREGQERALAERRDTMSRDVLKEEAAAGEGERRR